MIHPKRAVYMGFVQVNLEYSLLRYIEFSFRDVRWWQGCDDETGEENAGVDYHTTYPTYTTSPKKPGPLASGVAPLTHPLGSHPSSPCRKGKNPNLHSWETGGLSRFMKQKNSLVFSPIPLSGPFWQSLHTSTPTLPLASRVLGLRPGTREQCLNEH